MKALFFSFIFLAPLLSTIDLVEIAWDPGLCWDACQRKLTADFLKLKEVDSATVDGALGRATIHWKKEAPFSFVPINWTLRATGVRQSFIRLIVTGKVREERGAFILKSPENNTEFTLLGPLVIRPNQAAARRNPTTQILTEEMIESLRQIIKNKEQATISGEFFQPFRAPPNFILIEKITAVPPPPNK